MHYMHDVADAVIVTAHDEHSDCNDDKRVTIYLKAPLSFSAATLARHQYR